MKKIFNVVLLFSLIAALLIGGASMAYANDTQTNSESSTSISDTGSEFAGLKDSAKSFEASPDELNSLLSDARIAVVEASIAEQEIRKMYPNATLQVYAAFPDLFAALSSGKVDYVAAQDNTAAVYLNSDPSYQYATSAIMSCPDHLAVKKGNTELLNKINTVLKKYNEDGTSQEIIDRWFSGDYNAPDIPECTDGPVLKLGIISTAEPISFVYNNEIVGVDVEFMQRIAYDLGMQLEIVDMAFNALFPALESGKIDVITCLSYTPERAESIDFTDVYLTEHVLAIRYDASAANTDFFTSLKNSFTKTFITENRWVIFLNGLGVTVLISVMAFILGSVLGAFLCLMSTCRFKALNHFSNIYVTIVTGIPSLVWLMILYYVIFGNADVSAVFIAILGFGFVEAASLSGIFQTGLDSVDKGQLEAASALGFRQFAIFKKIILPQAADHIFDLYAGEFSALIKGTSIVGYIAITDLTKASDIVRSRTFEAFFPLIATALIYFAVICIVLALLKLLQRKFKPKLRKKSTILKGVNAR